ncbi:hypothetical protein ROJ8625_03024 [Roseivivax jejudonensis]|uniref:Uncharacterized protein n=1 Tax=Roseivivax jejudonensis TaxID=1529041 RepID=A0A1X6ZRW5_9RHOB|nr:hypothetical protein [Roseivivax jejudonensis]SLN59749.1 hypothetical protein ROJ8625_03024 [Roseivivax jejudonensis]
MRHDWIINVLSDLGTFARQNGLTALAAQIEDAKFVAHAEIASRAEDEELELRIVDHADREDADRFGVG